MDEKQAKELRLAIRAEGMQDSLDVSDVAEKDNAGEYTGKVIKRRTVWAKLSDPKTGNSAVSKVSMGDDLTALKATLEKELTERVEKSRKLTAAAMTMGL